MESSSTLVLGVLGNGRDYLTSQPISLSFVLADSEGGIAPSELSETRAEIRNPEGDSTTVEFRDDGAGEDAEANDGIYVGTADLAAVGEYALQVFIDGSRNGERFMRVAVGRFRIVESCGSLTDAIDSEVVDKDQEATPEGIAINVPIQTSIDGNFHVLIILQASNGRTLAVSDAVALTAGLHTVELLASTEDLLALEADGPYEIRRVRLSCLTERGLSLSDERLLPGATPDFELGPLNEGPLSATGTFQEQGVDVDDNGLFDRLETRTEVRIAEAGDYDWSGALVDPAGAEVATAIGSGTLQPPTAMVALDFVGRTIGEHAVDGPYTLVALDVFGSGGSASVSRAGDTRAYGFDQFEAAPERPPGPQISAGGIVDAAQFQPVLSRGGIGSIFGSQLADAVAGATDVPLPTHLGGVQVEVNGVLAPLFFVSPGQINFQVPFEASSPGEAGVVVTRNGEESPPEPASMAEFAPAVFLNPATGEPIIQRHPDGALITAANPAKPGDVLIIFVTGIGGVSNPPATGAAAAASPLAQARVTPVVTVGGEGTQVFFAGLAPFFVGLGQVNIQLPESLATAGATMPLVIDFEGSRSPPVNLPVRFEQ